MAVRVSNHDLLAECEENSPKHNRLIIASLLALRFCYYFALIASITSSVALVYLLFFQKDVLISLILFAQWAISFGIIAAVMLNIFRCANLCITFKDFELEVLPGAYLRRAAILLLLFFIIGSLLTYLVAYLNDQTALPVSLKAASGSFPSAQDWELVLGGATEPSASKIVGIDCAPLFCSLFLWVMSYAVNYLVIRSNQLDHVV